MPRNYQETDYHGSRSTSRYLGKGLPCFWTYLYTNEDERKHHLGSGGHAFRFLGRFRSIVPDPVNTVELHQKGSVRHGQGQIEADIGNDTGEHGGFYEEGDHEHAGEHVASEHHDGHLWATGFDQTIVTWSGRNHQVRLKSGEYNVVNQSVSQVV